MNQPVAPASFEIQLKEGWLADYIPVDKNTQISITGQWITCELPLSSFTNTIDYASFVASGNDELWICTKNKTDDMNVNTDIYFDNFRIVDITK